jgi:hypothetical protein
MKKVVFFISFAFVVIAGVMLYLVKVGVSLRPAEYIKPSVMTDGIATVARDVSLRIFPELQSDDYLVWGLPDESALGGAPSAAEARQLVELLKNEEERVRAKKITVMADAGRVSDGNAGPDLQNCAVPCWILRPQDQAHELAPNSFIAGRLRPLAEKNSQHYFTMTVIPFQFGQAVPDECWGEKRLDFRCIQLVSIQAAEKKLPKDRVPLSMKPPQHPRHFFMNKYNEHDFFLFIEL